VDEAAKKTMLGMLPYGLLVLTAHDGRSGSGMAVNWVSQCSFKPPLLVVAVEPDSHTLALVRASGRFALTLLRPDQRQVATSLSRPWKLVPTKLDQVPQAVIGSGLPVPAGGLGAIECAVRDEHTHGDHVLVIGEVTEAVVWQKAEPLTLRAAGLRYGW
jgi:flavin reductase (DIM6/NTAB) family NADH-FMN oxidoreductase RutF